MVGYSCQFHKVQRTEVILLLSPESQALKGQDLRLPALSWGSHFGAYVFFFPLIIWAYHSAML